MFFFTEFLKNILDFIFGIIGNYGWSVVVFVLLIRLVLLPLDIKSKKAMHAMQRLNPKMDALKKKYGKDQEKLNKKMSELYRKEKINPMAGCLPMLIQLPILFCMFSAMRVVANEHTIRMLVEWSQAVANGVQDYAPTFQSWLWVKNVFQPDTIGTILPEFGSQLSAITAVGGSQWLTAENIQIAKDFLSTPVYQEIAAAYGANQFTVVNIWNLLFTVNLTLPTSLEALWTASNGYFILPILAVISQLFMTKITSSGQPQQQADPNQPNMNSGMMKWMFPIMSLIFCMTSSAAFAIYWVMANVIQIVNQVVINAYLDRQDKIREQTQTETDDDNDVIVQ